MSEGIFYYSNFGKIAPLLAVSLHSLRKYYDGNVHVCFGDETPQFFLDLMANQKDITYNVVEERYYQKGVKEKQKGWYEKPFALKHHSPFDVTIFYDIDHVFHKKFDTTLFEVAKKDGLFSSIKFGYAKRHDKIRKEISEATGFAFEDFPKISSACVGYDKKCGYVDEWIKRFYECRDYGKGIIGKNSEEFGLAVVFKLGMGVRVSEKYSYGYPRKGTLTEVPEEVAAMHYCAGRYEKGDLWMEAFAEAYNENYLGLKDEFDQYASVNSFVASFKNNDKFLEITNG